MNPVNSISDILEHAPEGHEEVSILKPRFTAVRRQKRFSSSQSQQVRNTARTETVQNTVCSLCSHLTMLLYCSSDLKEGYNKFKRSCVLARNVCLNSSTTVSCDCNSYFSPTLQEDKKTAENCKNAICSF